MGAREQSMPAKAYPPLIDGFDSRVAEVDGVRLHYWIGRRSRGTAGGPVARLSFDRLCLAARRPPRLRTPDWPFLVPDMRGFGDSDKPPGVTGYDARALAEEARALVAKLGFGRGGPVVHAAHDMGALPALLWAADRPEEVKALLYIEAPVMLGEVLRAVFAYTPEAMAQGSMWWWILPLAPDVPERLIVGNERAFLGWFYEGDHVINHAAFPPEVVDEYLRTFSGSQRRARQPRRLSRGVHQHRPNRAAAQIQDQDARLGDGRREGVGRPRRPDGRVSGPGCPNLGRADQRPLPSRGGACAGRAGHHSHGERNSV